MASPCAVCPICGDEKELPLGRCGACGDLPVGRAREIALLCSDRLLGPEELREVQARIRRGGAPEPSRALRDEARKLLDEGDATPAALSRAQLLGLVAGNLLLTPVLGLAVWYRLRRQPGPGAAQALWATLPVSALLGLLLVARMGLRINFSG